MAHIEPNFHMWATSADTVAALVLYAWELIPMEVTSVGVICALFLFFHFFPPAGRKGMRIDALALQRPPQPFDEDIVEEPTAPIHRDADTGLL